MRVTIEFTPVVEWADDWEIGSDFAHFAEFGEAYTDSNGLPREPDSCEQATVWGPQGECLASLGCVDDADDAYRREVEADLLSEALVELARLYPTP